MKSFFKKLSLVLVAAMVLTLIPAQNAKAAGTIKLALQSAKSSDECITSYMLKKGATEDFKFYGCADYKTAGIAWKSSNDAVATVDKNGVVTAVAAGAAQITYEATGYTCEPLTVVVADEYSVFIAKQDATDALPTFTMNVKDAAVDFRFIGAKGWSTSKNGGYWTSTNEAVAKVDKNGVVTPVAKGECDIVLTIIDKATGKVAFAVQPMHVTVKAEELEVAQIAYNAAKVTFDGKAVAADDLDVYLVGWDENKAEQLIKEYVIVDGDKVTFYNDIVNGQKYCFDVKGQKAYLTGNVGDCASFDVAYSSKLFGTGAAKNVAYADQDLTFVVSNFKDANGVVINAKGYTWEYVDTCTVDGEETVTQYYENDQLYIPAKSHHVVEFIAYNAENVKACSKTIEIDAVDAGAWAIESVNWAIGPVETAFKDCGASTKLSIDDDTNYGFAVQFIDTFGNKFNSAAGACDVCVLDGTAVGSVYDEIDEYGQITFESSNPNVVAVMDDGTLEIIKENSKATIFCYFQALENGDGKLQPRKLLFAVTIDTIGHLVPTSVAMTVNGQDVTRYYLNEDAGACDFNKATVKFVVKDQLGRAMEDVKVWFKAYDQTSKAQALKNDGDDYNTVFDARFGNAPFVDKAGSDEIIVVDDLTNAKGELAFDLVALDIPADGTDGYKLAYKGILNTRFDFVIEGEYGTAKKTLNIGTFDTSNMVAKDEPGIFWTTCDDAKEGTALVGAGLGNSDNNGEGDALWLALHVVDVYAASGAKVYGDNYTKTPVDVYANDNIAKLTKSSDLATFADITFIQFEATNAPLADGEVITDVEDGIFYVMVRKAFNDLSDGSNLEDAEALSKLKDVTIDAKVWQVLNTNSHDSNAAHATWNKRVISTYDAAEKKTFKNNDVANYALKLQFVDLYYVGDSPATTEQWFYWLTEHAWLEISRNNDAKWPNDKKDANKQIDSFKLDWEDWEEEFLAIPVAANNSKYLRELDCYFAYGDCITYIPVAVGKTIRPWTYEYKYENQLLDLEGR